MNGAGVLLLWNDIEPAVDAEYNRWHSREHVPERVSVPGILAGRRYAIAAEEAARRGAQRYLSVYELESVAVLASAPYLALLDSPTPWSRSMRPHFRNLERAGARRVASAGTGAGSWLLVPRIRGARPDAPARRRAVEEIAALDGVVCAHWCEADAVVPGLDWNAGGAAPPAFDEALLAEATDRAAIEAARLLIEEIVRAAARGGSVDCGPAYALLHLVEKRA